MPYRRTTRLGQALCRHEYGRVGHGADFETTVWFCRKCGKEISVEAPKRNAPEGECAECGRKLGKYQERCPDHPFATVWRLRKGKK